MALLLCLALQAHDNLEWPYWKSMKVGSTATYKLDMTQGGQAMEGQMVRTLKEISAEKAVLEHKMKITVSGQTVEPPAETEEVKPKEEKQEKITKEGTEEIEVAGKKLKCRYLETEKEEDGQKIVSKVWAHDSIPGGIAKADVKMGEATTMKLTIVSWEKK
jgi:hypothetical protein